MKERINQIIQHEMMTAAQFADKIGISASSLSHILSGRNNPSLEVVMKIHKSCGYLNLDWLLYGTGEMESQPSLDLSVSPGRENAVFTDNSLEDSEYRKENASVSAENAPKEIVREQVKYVQMPDKKITEIRIFFDNGTYETFKPDK